GTYKSTTTETDIFAVKLSASGTDFIFAQSYTQSLIGGADNSAGRAIALDSAGSNAYLAGSVHISGGDNDILAAQIDNLTGNLVYSFTMSSPGDDTLTGIAVDQNGQAYVTGTFNASAPFIPQVSLGGAGTVMQT